MTTDVTVVPEHPNVDEVPCPLTVIVDADPREGDLAASVRAVQSMVAGMNGQVIVTCQERWSDAPEDVDVVVFPSDGKGDRYDAASRSARGELLAFVSSRVVLGPDWANEVVRLFDNDPTLTIVGGPVVPGGERHSQRVSALLMTHYLRGTPAAHNARPVSSRRVREVGSANLIIRRADFRAVGGFQAPAGGHGEAVRLCYKVRALLGGKIMSEPSLAVKAPAPDFPKALLGDIATYGRSRGDMARRLREAAPLFPYAVPSVIALVSLACVALIAVSNGGVERAAPAAVLGVFLVLFIMHSVRALRGAGPVIDRVLAGLALPVMLFVFGMSFLRGLLGRSLEDISPPRDRVAPLRVLILNWRDVTHPWSGGAETYMHQIARRWAADGMDVGWLTQRHSGSARSEVIDRIRIMRIGGSLTQYPLASLVYLFRLRRRYDVVVDCENGIPFFSPLYSRLPKVLVVHHVHQEIFRNQLPRQVRWFAMWLEGSLMPRLYRKAQVVAVSQGTSDDLVGLGFDPARITIARNGVVPPTELGHSASLRPTILCMGRLKPQKSVDVLIRAIPAILKEFPDLRVDIVGQGPDRTRLERLAWSTGLASHVRFHGYVRAEVRDQISAEAWISVCPSSFEGWGVVCMEASARGLPVVASNVAGLRESIRDGETGVLFPYGDQDALAKAVVALLGSSELRVGMGIAGREWAASHTWEASASDFAELLHAMVGGQPGTAQSSTQPALAFRW